MMAEYALLKSERFLRNKSVKFKNQEPNWPAPTMNIVQHVVCQSLSVIPASHVHTSLLLTVVAVLGL